MAKIAKPTIDELTGRNVVDIIDRESLRARLQSGKKLRIKLGCDPTSPDLHLGHAILLWKLREFQDLGHTIVFIIGDFTAAIGDPSGRSVVRPVLSAKEIAKNAKTYFQQVGTILDVKKVEVRKNSEWLRQIKLDAWLSILKEFTVSRILERDDFKLRLKEGREVWLHEIMYPLLQAYDSVMIKADVELGGLDQLFNLMAGRHLMEKLGHRPQDIIVTDYLVGLDGEKKMSKSLGNYIGITEKPGSMFGKVMSIPDELIVPYFTLAARRPSEEASIIERRLKKGENPRDLKLELAKEIVSLYHGAKSAEAARAEFINVFSKKELPSAIEEAALSEGSYEAVALILALGLAKSRSEAWRLVEQGAVEVIPRQGLAVRLQKPRDTVNISTGTVVRVGKTKFVRIR